MLFHAIMLLLRVDIPPLDGVVNLQFLMSKKHTLEMMECEDGFMNSEVRDAVHKGIEEYKIDRKAKLDKLRENAAKCSHGGWDKLVLNNEGVCLKHGVKCSHCGSDKPSHIRLVCRQHGKMCSHDRCDKPVYIGEVCKQHGAKCSHDRCDKPVYIRVVCRDHTIVRSAVTMDATSRFTLEKYEREHGAKCSHDGCDKPNYNEGICRNHAVKCSQD